MKSVIAAIVAGIVIFFWGFISWTVLPWHNTDMESFKDKEAVMQVLLENGSEAGVYYIPEEDDEYTKDTPGAFVNLLPKGHQVGMGGMMIKGVIANIIMAGIGVFLLSMTTGLSYLQRVTFLTVVGLAVGFSSSFMYYNWFSFPAGYSLVNLLDSVVAWLLAGLVIAKIAPSD